MKPVLRRVETEVLPPEGTPFERDERLMKFVAKLMDTAFVIPGTNIRFGLDPIIGLLPGAGDAVDAVISTLMLSRAARYGVPGIILVRMALNVILNTVIGSLPVVGDAFSVWFKSNAMNYELLRKHASTKRAVKPADWIFVIAVIATVLCFIVLSAYVFFFLVGKLLEVVKA